MLEDTILIKGAKQKGKINSSSTSNEKRIESSKRIKTLE